MEKLFFPCPQYENIFKYKLTFLLSVDNPAGERFKRSEEICDFALSGSVGESPDVNDVLVLTVLIKAGLIITILRNIKI